MTAALLYTAAGIAALAAALRAGQLRIAADSSITRTHILIFAALSVTCLVMSPPSQRWINHYLPDLFIVIGHISVLVAAYAAVRLAHRIKQPQHLTETNDHHHRIALATTIIILIAKYVWAYTHDADPTTVIYTTVYTGYLAYTLARLTILIWQLSLEASGSFRLGLRLLSIGAATGIAYAAGKLKAALLDTSPTPHHRGVCQYAFESTPCALIVGTPAVTSSILILAGLVLPASAAALHQLQRCIRLLRSYRQLEPLWQSIRQTVPELAHHDNVPARGVWSRLTTRVIEIRDGLLILSSYRNSTLVMTAYNAVGESNLTDQQQRAIIEAAQIGAAQQQRRSGRTTPHPAPTPPHNHNTFDDEIAWLTQVAKALHSPAADLCYLMSYDQKGGKPHLPDCPHRTSP